MHLRFSCPHTFLQLCCARSFDGTGNRHRSYTWVPVQALHLTHFDFYLWIFSSYIVTPSYPQLYFGLLDLATLPLMICDQCLLALLITFFVNLKNN